MHPLQFHGLSTRDAEELIAAVWVLLERHQIASPKLSARRSGSRLDIVLGFPSERDCAQISTGLHQRRFQRARAKAIQVAGD